MGLTQVGTQGAGIGVRRGVIGILRRADRLLMVRRAEGVAKGGRWCFPGGHVEAGETPRRAVERELAEELGIEVAAVVRLGSLRVVDSRHVLAAWEVRYVAGELAPLDREIADVRWVPAGQVATLRAGLPSNLAVLRMLGRYTGRGR